MAPYQHLVGSLNLYPFLADVASLYGTYCHFRLATHDWGNYRKYNKRQSQNRSAFLAGTGSFRAAVLAYTYPIWPSLLGG